MYNTKATEGERSVTIIHVEVLEETKFSHKSQSPVGLPRHTFPQGRQSVKNLSREKSRWWAQSTPPPNRKRPNLSGKKWWVPLHSDGTIRRRTQAIRVVEFSSGKYKIGKIFA